MNTTRMSLLTAALIAAALSSVGATNTKRPAATSPPIPAPVLTSDVQGGLVISLRPTGFDPARIDIPQGNYLFIVQNRSGIRDLTFRVSTPAGTVVQEVHDQRLQWKRVLQLPSGIYTVGVVGHPDWQSVINVGAN